MKKKLLITFAAVAAVLCAMSATAFADGQGTAEDPYIQDGIKYVTDSSASETKEVYVSGYDEATMPADVVIPETVSISGEDYTVTAIESLAFVKNPMQTGNVEYTETLSNSKLQSISIPHTVTDLAKGGIMEKMRALYPDEASKKFPQNMNFLLGAANLDGAAGGTNNKTPATSLDDYTDVSGSTFYGCVNLNSVTFRTDGDGAIGITKLPGALFTYCSNLNEFTIPKEITEIGQAAFMHTGIDEIRIPSTVTTLGGSLFSNCPNLKAVYFEHDTKPTFSETTLTESYVAAFFAGCSGVRVYSDCEDIRTAFSSDGEFYNANRTNVSFVGKITPDPEKEDAWGGDTIELQIKPGTEDNVFEVWAYPHSTKYIKKFSSIQFNLYNAADAVTGGSTTISIEGNAAGNIAAQKVDRTTEHNRSYTECAFYVKPSNDSESQGYKQLDGTGIKLGTITVNGYGDGTLVIAAPDVYREEADSIVTDTKTYSRYVNQTKGNDLRYGDADANYPGDYTDQRLREAEGDYNGVVVTAGSTDRDGWDRIHGAIVYHRYSITEKTASVHIYVLFPNNVESSAKDYAKMSLTIDDGIQEPYTADLASHNRLYDTFIKEHPGEPNPFGTNDEVTYRESISTGAIEGWEKFDGCSAYDIYLRELPANNHFYRFKLSGDGYRTAETSVMVNGNLNIFFWNNVMDEETAITNGEGAPTQKKNFVAGDIQMNSKIDIYDLNAVTSFFGENEIKNPDDGSLAEGADATKIQYDLNRDGKIDAEDIAYVLVSWGE